MLPGDRAAQVPGFAAISFEAGSAALDAIYASPRGNQVPHANADAAPVLGEVVLAVGTLHLPGGDAATWTVSETAIASPNRAIAAASLAFSLASSTQVSPL